MRSNAALVVLAVMVAACGAGTSKSSIASPSASSRPTATASAEPDAYRLAYLANVDGINQVFIRAPDGTSVQVSTITDERYYASGLAWSPDGEWLAYARGIYEIWLARAGGSDDHLLVPGHSPRWAPDGQQLVFSSPGNPGIAVDIVSSDAVLIGVSGGEAAGTAEQIGISREVWTPDGIRFIEGLQGGFPTLQLYDPETGARTPLLAARAVAWSPDFSRLAFVRLGACGSSTCPMVGLANPDGSDAVDVASGYLPVWSPDGAYVAFLHEPLPGDTPVLRLMTRAGELVEVADQIALDLAWAPDSRALGVVAGPDLTMEIVLYSLEDRSTTTLAVGEEPAFAP